MSDETPKVVVPVSPCFLLFLVFLILKLTGTIAWSWWWVTAPLWLPLVFVLGVVAVILLLAFVAALIGD